MCRTKRGRLCFPEIVGFSVIVASFSLLLCGCELRSAATTQASPSRDKPSNQQTNEIVEPRDAGSNKPLSVRNIRWEDLEFEIEPGEPFERAMLTEGIEALVGQTIRLRGFMLPTLQRKGVKQFIFIRDDQKCCFGPGASIYHSVQIEMVEGATAAYTTKPVAITGQFDIRPFVGPDDKHWAIYHVVATSVE